jgi:micrococcal nuclease
VRVRMNGIDCPERKQDFYQAAKDALGKMVFKKYVKLVVTGRDRNRRVIAVVFCNRQNINLAMIRTGYAWHYKKYSTDPSFADAELQARKKRIGIWKMKNPVAPWEFRSKK